jgi:outer membrane protein
MRAIPVFLLLACSLKVDGSAARGPMRLAVVDMQRALLESKSGALAKARLMERYTKDQRELDEEQSRIRREQELGVDKSPGGMEAMQKRLLALQTRYTTLQAELNAAEQKEAQEVTAQLTATLTTLANEKGFELVIDKASAPFAKAELDVTDELVKRFNAQK